MKENLFLIVTKEWYDKIASGEKRVEYREDREFWDLKFLDTSIYKTIQFQCGYSLKYPRLNFKIEKISFIKTPEDVKNTIHTSYCYAIYFK